MRNLKKVLALVLAMVMSLSLAVTAGATSLADYSDSEQVTEKYAVAVDVATQLGVLKGMGDDVYAPQGTLTRAQLATMIYRITTGDVEDEYTANFAGGAADTFTDTPATAWYAGYVAYSADAGFLKGMGDGTYAPDSALTGYQALAALLRGLGYNEAGHNFCGADWTVQVAKVAKTNGILEGITGVALDKAITREVAAQMIYNALFAEMVEWEGFVYEKTGETLAEEVFGIESDKDGEAAAGDFGRPSTEWYDDEGEALVSIPEAPLAVYTEAVSECQIAVDMDLEENETVDLWVNGEKGELDVTLTSTAATVGGQGCLTEVYDGVVVCIDTYLAEVIDVITEKADSKGHIIRDAAIELEVFDDEDDAYFFETKDFAEGDMVLVTIDAGEVATVVDAKSATGELTGLTGNRAGTDNIQNVKAIDFKDVTVNRTATYEVGMALEANYVFYYDTYGNVIGSENVPSEYVVIDSIWFETIKGETTVYADVVDFAANETEEVVVANPWIVFENKAMNQGFYYHVYEYVIEDGEYILFDGNFTDFGAVSYTAGDKTLTPGFGVQAHPTQLNNDTVVLMQTAFSPDGQYTTYTGVNNIPTFLASEVEVLDEDNDGYADLIYVLGARTSDRIVFVADVEAEASYVVDDERVVVMDAFELVDGKLVETTFVTKGWYDNGVFGPVDIDTVGLYEITESDDGFTWFVERDIPFAHVSKLTDDGNRVMINTPGFHNDYYDLDNAEIFKFEGTWTAVEDVTEDDEWTKADLDHQSLIFMQEDEDGNVVAVYDMWIVLDVVGDTQYVTAEPTLYAGKTVTSDLKLFLPAHASYEVDAHNFFMPDFERANDDSHADDACNPADHKYCVDYEAVIGTADEVFFSDIVVDVTLDGIAKHKHTGLTGLKDYISVEKNDAGKYVVALDVTDFETYTVADLKADLKVTCGHANQTIEVKDNTGAVLADLTTFVGKEDITVIVTAEDGTIQQVYPVVISVDAPVVDEEPAPEQPGDDKPVKPGKPGPGGWH